AIFSVYWSNPPEFVGISFSYIRTGLRVDKVGVAAIDPDDFGVDPTESGTDLDRISDLESAGGRLCLLRLGSCRGPACCLRIAERHECEHLLARRFAHLRGLSVHRCLHVALVRWPGSGAGNNLERTVAGAHIHCSYLQ